MARGTENGRILREGLRAARERLLLEVCKKLAGLGRRLIETDLAAHTQAYRGFTGQTQTGYAYGVYLDGRLWHSESTGQRMKPPVAKKVRRGKRVFLKKPYEGAPRSVYGQVSVSEKDNSERTLEALMRYKPDRTQRATLVVTNGTEYWEYVGKNQKGWTTDNNILTFSYKTAGSQAEQQLKSITIA